MSTIPLMGIGPGAPASGTPKTVALYHFDSDYSDASGNQTAMSATQGLGSVSISSLQSVFGGASVLFVQAVVDNNNSYLSGSLSVNNPFAGTADFTIECRWQKTVDAVQFDPIFSVFQDANNVFHCFYHVGNGLYIFVNIGGVQYTTLLPWSPSNNTWYAIAYQKRGGVIELFVEGGFFSNLAGTPSFPSSLNTLFLGALATANPPTNSSWTHTGYVDELRVSNVARYLPAGYTPATSAFTPD